jgi:hypothetical protein
VAALKKQPSHISTSKLTGAQFEKLQAILDIDAQNMPEQIRKAGKTNGANDIDTWRDFTRLWRGTAKVHLRTDRPQHLTSSDSASL